MSAKYDSYDTIPWRFRENTNRNIIALGFLCALGTLFGIPILNWGLPLSMAIVSANALSGDIYKNRVHDDGSLKKWGTGYKVYVCLATLLMIAGNLVYFNPFWPERGDSQTQFDAGIRYFR